MADGSQVAVSTAGAKRGYPASSYGIALFVYAYFVLLFGGALAYTGTTVWSVVEIATLLLLPSLAKRQLVGTVGLAASATNAMIFALAAYGIGHGIASLLGT